MTTSVSNKAKEASALVQLLHSTNDPRKRTGVVELLNNIWPSIRCRYEDNVGLKVWYLGERVHRLPRVLNFSASYIEVVQSDGTARILKDRFGQPSDEPMLATICLSEFSVNHNGRTVWELIADPLNWI